MPSRKSLKPCQGFTLAELLIALTILGVIATFTIPKILTVQQNAKYNAIAKETAAMISGALIAYKASNTLSDSTTAGALTPYMNYVKVDSTSAFDYEYGSSTGDCGSGTDVCLKLHNGAILNYAPTSKFNGTNTTNAVYFYLDPDGTSDNTTNGPGKSVLLWLYADERITSYSYALTNTTTYFAGSNHVYGATAGADPPWFSW
jgi:prepilin-type N-terminal cleavage/methylation domain-containing protein